MTPIQGSAPAWLRALREKARAGLVPSKMSEERLRLPWLEQRLAQHGARLAGPSRPLKANELALAQTIFAASLDYDRIRIVQTRLAAAPTTLGDTIRVRGPMRDSTLVHELTHIWQFQTRGTAYISDSLCHQLASVIEYGHRHRAYQLTPAEIVAADDLDTLSAEQQAVFVTWWFLNRTLHFPVKDASRQRSQSSSARAISIREHPASQRLMQQLRQARPLTAHQVTTECRGAAHGHFPFVRREKVNHVKGDGQC